MDRVIVQPGAVPQDTDILSSNRNPMIAFGYLAQAMVGVGTCIAGLAVTPALTGMTVNVAQGVIFSNQTIDAIGYGSLPADTNPLVKMGINFDGLTNFPTPAPASVGTSIDYLIEAAFLESDGGSAFLPYYNAANPSQPYSGPGNDGIPQYTLRQQRVGLQIKAGSAATTGTQTIPATDIGYVPLAVVTIAYGQTSVSTGNITTHPQAPYIKTNLAVGQLRTKMSANLTLVVNATTGSDTLGNGTLVYPYATHQAAVNSALANYDTGGFNITINSTGSFTAPVFVNGALTGGGILQFVGNGTTNISTTNAHAFYVVENGAVSAQGLTLAASGSVSGVNACGFVCSAGGLINLIGTNSVGSCAGSQVWNTGGNIQLGSGAVLNLSGASTAAVQFQVAGIVNIIPGSTVNFVSAPTYSYGVFEGGPQGLCQIWPNGGGTTFTGSPVGAKYGLIGNAVLNTNGQTAYVPGSAAGSAGTGLLI
jgi:hypothetical protein